jgi:hypothetical protein
MAGETEMTQRILVTAGASGIGREIVRAFCAGGASVFVCDIDSKALQATSAELAGVKTGLCDISKRHDIERMMMECVRAMGGSCRSLSRGSQEHCAMQRSRYPSRCCQSTTTCSKRLEKCILRKRQRIAPAFSHKWSNYTEYYVR